MKEAERWQGGEPLFGLSLTYADAAIAELAAWCGYDFVILDAEHGVCDESAQLSVLRMLEPTPTLGLVRVRPRDDSAIARYLDFGADGILIPDVRSATQAQCIVEAAYGRWTGGLRADRYGAEAAVAKARALILVLIESEPGISSIEAIVAMPGIDGVIVGTGDLSTRLGMPGDFRAPAFLAALERIERATRAAGKILGGKPDPTAPIPRLIERGYRIFIIARDMPLMRRALTETLTAARRDTQRSEKG